MTDERRLEKEQESAEGDTHIGELLGASESGPADKQVDFRAGRRVEEILARLGLTP